MSGSLRVLLNENYIRMLFNTFTSTVGLANRSWTVVFDVDCQDDRDDEDDSKTESRNVNMMIQECNDDLNNNSIEFEPQVMSRNILLIATSSMPSKKHQRFHALPWLFFHLVSTHPTGQRNPAVAFFTGADGTVVTHLKSPIWLGFLKKTPNSYGFNMCW